MTTRSIPLRSKHDPVAHLSEAERVARGRAARSEVPRSSHAGFEVLPGRRDPIEVLQTQAATRVPELVPLRYGRMAASPFAFYRGAAAVMAADLAGTPRSGLQVQACGDAHLVNFGLYFSPERRLVFDINDFDETLPGPWEWDLKRLAASMVVAARANGFSSQGVRGDRARDDSGLPQRHDAVLDDAQPGHLVLQAGHGRHHRERRRPDRPPPDEAPARASETRP